MTLEEGCDRPRLAAERFVVKFGDGGGLFFTASTMG
jgi:hypothetical protein